MDALLVVLAVCAVGYAGGFLHGRHRYRPGQLRRRYLRAVLNDDAIEQWHHWINRERE